MTAEEFKARWAGHVPRLQGLTGEYAVLVPLVERPEGLCLLYEVRAGSLDRQPGEVCFPGGRMEPGEDPAACALRETWEELGIPPGRVEVVAQLDFLTHQGGFAMYPVLGVVDPSVPVVPGPAEVAEAFYVPVDWLRANFPVGETGLYTFTDNFGDNVNPDFNSYLERGLPGIWVPKTGQVSVIQEGYQRILKCAPTVMSVQTLENQKQLFFTKTALSQPEEVLVVLFEAANY